MTHEALQEAQTAKLKAETKLLEVKCLESIQLLQRLLGDDKVDGMNLSFDNNDNDDDNAASVEPVAKKRCVEKMGVMLRNEELIRLPHTA
eukprot:3933117-Rhodomonas_salina.1